MEKPTYYDCWGDYESVKNAYDALPPEDAMIYAGYTYEDYSGAALVVWSDGEKIMENNDGHCSCNGLENWEPEETSIAALRMRTGWPGLHEALDRFEARS